MRLIALLIAGFASAPAAALPNPASVHCVGQGGRLDIVRTDKGEVGYCVLPDGRRIEEWEFYRAYLAGRDRK